MNVSDGLTHWHLEEVNMFRAGSSPKMVGWITGITLILGLTLGYLISNNQEQMLSNKDPKVGKVYIDGDWGLYKICDGMSLVYSDGDVLINSPECSHD